MGVQRGLSGESIEIRGLPGVKAGPEQYVRVPEHRREEFTLVQHSRLRGLERRLTLFNGHFVEWQESCRGKLLSRRVINLAFIDPQPCFRHEIAYRWLAVATGILAAGAFCAWLAWLVPAVLLVSAALVMALAACHRSCDRVVFRTRTGGIAVFELFSRLPTRYRLQEWLDLLGERATYAASILPSGSDAWAAEVAEHRRMAAEGWLSERRYNLARRRILARFGGARGAGAASPVHARSTATVHQMRDRVSAPYAHPAS